MQKTNKRNSNGDLIVQINKISGNFLINPPLKLEEKKFMVAVFMLDVHNSVFNLAEHTSILAIYTPGYREDGETIKKLKQLTELKSAIQNQLQQE